MTVSRLLPRRALLSVSDKTGLADLARDLAAHGVELLSTGGTAQALRDAGLDVTDPEPLPADHPLLGMENVIVTPHIASSTTAGRERMLVQAMEQVLMVLGGGTPSHLVVP